jgi:CheY-like chemotaxis protein
MKFRALLVDDEPSVLVTLLAILQLKGLDVHTATSGRAARDLLHSNTFDLVITDISMETKTAGYEVVLAAKLHPDKPTTLVISGYPELLADWQKEGADAMLNKPTDTSEFLSTVDVLLNQRQSHKKNI